MANKTDTSVNSAFLSAEIDVSEIFSSIISIIESLRSSDPVLRGRIPRADENLGSEDGESLFNAFLRSLGIPAVRDDVALGKANEKISLDQKSQDGTLNYFEYAKLGLTEGDVDGIIRREEALASVRKLDASPTADKNNVLSGLQLMLKPPAPAASINGSDGRRSLFPLVVCGDVTVYPLSGRTKPMFSKDGDPGAYVQQRSFLEFVLRTKIGAKESANSSDLKEAIKSKILALGVAEGSTTPDPLLNDKQAIIGGIDNEEVFSLRIIQKLLQALEASALDYAESKKLARSYMQDVSYVPSFNGRSPFVRQGNFDISYEEIIKFLDETDPSKKAELGVDKKPRLDAAVDSLELEKLQSDQFFDLMIRDDVSGTNSNTISAFRQDLASSFDGTSRGFGTGTFEEVIVSICTLDRGRVAEEVEAKKAEMTRIRSELEIIRSKLDIYSGYTCGFSIFDFLAIILSLYILPIETLAGLMNDQGKQSSKVALGNITAAFTTLNGKPTIEARKELENSVTQILNIANAAFQKAETGSK